MRLQDRWNYLRQAGKISWDITVRGQYDYTYDLMPCHALHMPVRKRLNMLRTGANLIYRRPHAWGWPMYMNIELTNYCNLRCKVCPTGRGSLTRKPASIDVGLFARLINEVGPYPLIVALWAWGEPLLHPQLADILQITQGLGVTTLLSTNGQNLNDDEVHQALINYPPTYLIVCLDGLTDETLSAFRVGAKLDNALSGVRRLAELKRQKGAQLPVLHLRHIVMKHNEHEVAKVPEFAGRNGFDVATIRTLSIIDSPEDMHREFIPADERWKAYSYKDGERISRTDFICEKAFTFPAVFADGTVVACDQDCNAQQPLGRLADGSSFKDIWWSKRAAEVRKTIRDNPDRFSFCKNCPFRDRPVKDCSVQYFDLRR